MMRAYAFNSNVDPVKMEITDMEQIPISHFCDSE